MATGIAPKLPLVLDENDGAFGLIKDYVEMIRQNLKMLILTSPGERIMDMNYGVGLRNFLFLENSQGVYNDISAKMEEQIAFYMPFIEIENLIVTGGEEGGLTNTISIKLYYKILPLGTSDLLTWDEKIQ